MTSVIPAEGDEPSTKAFAAERPVQPGGSG
jgi:hypothetical protein